MSEAQGAASQYYPGVDAKQSEFDAVAKGEVIRGEPIRALEAGSGFHTKYDTGKPFGVDGGKEVTTIRGEYSSGTIHGHPREF